MIRIVCHLVGLCLLALLIAGAAAAGTLSGVVRNGTTGAAAAGVDVVLIQLQGGMETVANSKSDAQGRFRFEHPALGRQPMLVRAVYRGVNFHQAVPPGRDTAEVDVFEPTADAKALQVASRLIVLQPNGAVLLVGEEFAVLNHSTPPAAYYKADGNFEFQIPEGGELAQVSAWGPSGMPVVQGTIDRGSRRYSIAFAFRPGESGVRLSYHVPYTANEAVLRATSPYAAQRVLLIAPPTLQVASAGFQPAGTEQGWSVYAREGVPAGAQFDIAVSGTAPPPSESGPQGQTDAQGRDAGRSAQPVQALPGRLDSLKWVLVGGFGALFALGVGFLWRRPAGATNAQPAGKNSQPNRRGASRETDAALSQAAAEVQREVNHSLDQLKETLFRLELRRQAGTISEEEYAREHGRAEKVLRELVKG